MAPAVLESKPGLPSPHSPAPPTATSSIPSGPASSASSPWTSSTAAASAPTSTPKLHRTHCSSRRSRNLLRNALLLIAPAILHAQDKTQNKISLDTNRSEIHFTLTDTLHTVKGTFHIQQGDITFDPATGHTGGSILVDALSGKSGNPVRDHRMAKEELKAPDYKTVAFAPTRFSGAFNPTGDSTLQVHGLFTLLGTPHEIDVPMQVQVGGDQIHAVGSFVVPYVQWGLKDPSTFMIKVEKEVHVDLDLTGTLGH
jgi:polyisoprenoid-binding protein YceI